MSEKKFIRKEAIALSYDSQKSAGPKVVAKGKGKIAENILETATLNDVHKAIQANEERDKAESIVELPKVVDGIQVSYKRENTYEYILVLILGVVCAFGMCIAKDKEIDKEIQKRKSAKDFINGNQNESKIFLK